MMTSPKKVSRALVLLVAVLVVGITAAVAMAAPAPKTTGGIGYTVGSDVQRHLSFNAIQSKTNTCSTFWNVTGVTSITFTYLGINYEHAASLTQNGQDVTGTGGYTGLPLPGGATNTWEVNAGSGSRVVGNNLDLSIDYTAPPGVVGIVLTMDGTIAPNGSISGSFTQDGGLTHGTFMVAAGSATPYATYCGKGNAYYSDAAGNWYLVNVKAVSVAGNEAWFAGPVIAGNAGITGQWLFIKVKDNGEPGTQDKVWGQVTDEITAVNGVIAKTDPGTGPITINSGNLQVHKSS